MCATISNFGLFLTSISLGESKNLALESTYKHCGKTEIKSRTITDGITKDQEPLIITDECDEGYGFIDFILNGSHSVSYVTLYLGADGIEQWDYFSVHLYPKENWVLCAEYPGTAIEEIVLPCDGDHVTSKVRLQTRVNANMALIEFEINSLDIDGHRELAWLGCFSDFRMSKTFQVDLLSCRQKCTAYAFMALKMDTCLCGHNYNSEKEVSPFKCRIECTGLNIRMKLYCGGDEAYSVYKVEAVRRPYYIGCFKTNSTNEENKKPTIQECRFSCRNLFFMSIKGGMCSCENDAFLIKDKISDPNLCDYKCQGEPKDICGGGDASSVYRTCYNKFNSLACNETFHCKKIEKTGTCDECKEGYTGFSCVHRVFDHEGCWIPNICNDTNSICIDKEKGIGCECKTNFTRFEKDRKCEENKCVTNNSCIDQNYTECIWDNEQFVCNCVEGYDKNVKTNVCEENECFTKNPCLGKPNRTCQISDGKIVCPCLAGYEEDDNGVCREDKCLMLNPCTDPNSICKTLHPDNYECICKDGFKDIDKACIDDQCSKLQPCSKSPNEVCIQTANGYKCECKEGYVRENESVPCEEDKCSIANPCDGHTEVCKTLNQAAFCVCKSGQPKVNGTCITNCEPNSCVKNKNTKCKETLSSFECVCKDDDHVDPNKDGNCEENVCNTELLCKNVENSRCEFINKIFQCICEEGFIKDENFCITDELSKMAVREDHSSKMPYLLFIIPIFSISFVLGYSLYTKWK